MRQQGFFLEMQQQWPTLTLSGSSTLTFRPGFARSGNTHSLLGLAKILPAEEDVSFPAASAAEGGVAAEQVDGAREGTGRVAGDGAGVGFVLEPEDEGTEGRASAFAAAGRAAMGRDLTADAADVDADVDGRDCKRGVGRGAMLILGPDAGWDGARTATDMTAVDRSACLVEGNLKGRRNEEKIQSPGR